MRISHAFRRTIRRFQSAWATARKTLRMNSTCGIIIAELDLLGYNMGMKKRNFLYIFIAVLVILIGIAGIYTQRYYHAEDVAINALESDAQVTVSETDYG